MTIHYDIAGRLVEDRRRRFEETAARRSLIRGIRRARRVEPILSRVEPTVEEALITTTPDREIDVVGVAARVALRP